MERRSSGVGGLLGVALGLGVMAWASPGVGAELSGGGWEAGLEGAPPALWWVLGSLGAVLLTGFVKFSVVLSLLRRALGTQEVPSTAVVMAVSALLAAFVSAPVALETARVAQEVEAHGELGPEDWEALSEPLRGWLGRHSGVEEVATFEQLGGALHRPEDRALVGRGGLLVLGPAFVLTELKEAFIIGFVVFVPFLVLELVVAGVLATLGLATLNPTTVSLPFKLLLFVLIDGWTLLVRGLVLGYA